MAHEQDTTAAFADTVALPEAIELGIGIWPDVPERTYHDHTAVGHSTIRNWIQPKKLGRAGVVGSATHCLALEGRSAYTKKFVVATQDLDLRTTEGKRAAVELVGDSGKTLLKRAEATLVERMSSALRNNSLSRRVIDAPGDNEVTAISRFPGFRHLYKCRIDMERKAIWDLKTTILVNEDEWLDKVDKRIEKVVAFGYGHQAEWYQTLYHSLTGETKPFCFLCVSKREPHNVWMHRVQDYQLAFARAWREDVLHLYERYVPQEMTHAAKRKR
jgi:hypothetical protein